MDLRAAVVAGVAAGVVYVATSEIDGRVTGRDNDDLKLLGRPFVSNPARAKIVGLPIHLINSAGLGVGYAKLAHDRLPGPSWLRGAIFANVENTVLYPLAALEQFHPGIRRGEIDRYWSLKAYLQSIPRHIAYGITVGWLYERLRRR